MNTVPSKIKFLIAFLIIATFTLGYLFYDAYSGYEYYKEDSKQKLSIINNQSQKLQNKDVEISNLKIRKSNISNIPTEPGKRRKRIKYVNKVISKSPEIVRFELPKTTLENKKEDIQNNSVDVEKIKKQILGSEYNDNNNSFSSNSGYTNPNHEYVNGYYKKNGTYVEGYYRTKKNSSKSDNFSSKGNKNPYTGKKGYK